MKFRLALPLLCLSLAACPDQGPKAPADFKRLTLEAFPPDGTKNVPGEMRLWTELYKLPNWYFLTTRDLAQQKQPSIELIDGQSYLVAFTDMGLLNAYARSRTLAPKVVAPAGDASVDDAAKAAAAAPVPDGGYVNPYFEPSGKPLAVIMTVEEAITYLQKYQGPPLAGVRFNEGQSKGWFGEPAAVIGIRQLLIKQGRL
jgi:hypothetical protein